VATDSVLVTRIGEVRRKLVEDGPSRVRAEDDFGRVSLPAQDCDVVRDLLIAERATTVVEIGLAYGSSALAIGEALVAVGAVQPRHWIIDPMQDTAFYDVGWDAIRAAGLADIATLLRDRSQLALPRLVTEGVSADAAFVDGSHIFHEVFVDLYFLRRIVRPGGIVILDDHWWPSVVAAARYYETNLGWVPISGESGTRDDATGQRRMRVLRLPDRLDEPSFKDFRPF